MFFELKTGRQKKVPEARSIRSPGWNEVKPWVGSSEMLLALLRAMSDTRVTSSFQDYWNLKRTATQHSASLHAGLRVLRHFAAKIWSKKKFTQGAMLDCNEQGRSGGC